MVANRDNCYDILTLEEHLGSKHEWSIDVSYCIEDGKYYIHRWDEYDNGREITGTENDWSLLSDNPTDQRIKNAILVHQNTLHALTKRK